MALHPGDLYSHLLEHFGQQDWWPVDQAYHKDHQSDPRFEIIVGAILTQNTAWSNVKKALENLKQGHALSLESIANIDLDPLRTMIQPSGFFNQKARRLKTITLYLQRNADAPFSPLLSRDTSVLRKELLALDGIGPETADSILLYAAEKPVFVVDAYTKRICKRIPLDTPADRYEVIQGFFQDAFQHLSSGVQRVHVFQQLHALIVELAKNYCRKVPRCDHCPLTELCQKML